MTPRSIARAACILLALCAAGSAAGCKKKPPLTPPPPALRPEPKAPPPPPPEAKKDCDPTRAADLMPSKTYDERKPRIDEAKGLAAEGTDTLRAAEGPSLDDKSREEMVTKAVDTLISALAADPYNVHATYNLAAAYARIKRKQCALNLLDRLIQMRDHPSRKTEVANKLDRLLGRGGTPLDPDFNELRNDPTFGCLINNIGTQAPKDCFASP